MRLGLYGGSFDPIHCGHIVPLRHARQFLGLDRVLYLPTARPPHKGGRRMAPSRARYTMVELALLDEEGLFVDDLEMDRTTVSYTIDTLEALRSREPKTDWVLFMGSDAFRGLESWHRWQDILTTAEIAILGRPPLGRPPSGRPPSGRPPSEGGEREAPGAVNRGPSEGQWTPALQAALDSGRARFVPESPLLDISSSAIRQRLASGEDLPPGWVPELVLNYLSKYELYS